MRLRNFHIVPETELPQLWRISNQASFKQHHAIEYLTVPSLIGNEGSIMWKADSRRIWEALPIRCWPKDEWSADRTRDRGMQEHLIVRWCDGNIVVHVVVDQMRNAFKSPVFCTHLWKSENIMYQDSGCSQRMVKGLNWPPPEDPPTADVWCVHPGDHLEQTALGCWDSHAPGNDHLVITAAHTEKDHTRSDAWGRV